MPDNSKTRLGYFIEFPLWQDAVRLLNFQIQQKKTNRHYNTFSMFYYEKLNNPCLNIDDEDYFKMKIASNLFYGLKKEFAVFYYVIPKSGLGLRNYTFFTYPIKIVYYSVGIYLLKLSEEFINERYKKLSNIKAYYGGNISYKDGKLKITSENIYYRSFYEQFKADIKIETLGETQNRIIIKLDIENYFNELSIPNLLQLLHAFIKPSIQMDMRYDGFTREQIICFFMFIAKGKAGIAQSDNNIISNFIGYLYLIFGDLFIDDILKTHRDVIEIYKIIRYTDDIHISITFKEKIDDKKQGELAYIIALQIAEVLYTKLNLKLNLKTRLFRLKSKQEKDELLTNIRKLSPNNEYTKHDGDPDETESSSQVVNNPQDKLKKIFKELRKIKKSKIEDYFVRDRSVQEEILQEVFDKRVEQILSKPENKSIIAKIFENFNFDLIKVQPLEILVIIFSHEMIVNNLKVFLIEKEIITISDADLIIRFLCQTNFCDPTLLLQLKKNTHTKEIAETFLDAKLNCDIPGYYNLTCMQMKRLSEMPDVIEQTRLRVLNEMSGSYSVALNHLVNEMHAVCIKQEKANKKDYDVNSVVKYINSKHISHETCIKIRNLFDRRNSNSVSHPGSDNSIAWEVTKEEYLDYYEHVGKCLSFLL